jgi:hypothetical protein
MSPTQTRRLTDLARPVALLLTTLGLVSALLVGTSSRADAWFERRCERHPIKCARAEHWAASKVAQFKTHHMPRTPDRRIRHLRAYYKHAWLKKYGPVITLHERSRRDSTAAGVPTPLGLCSGWSDCFDDFVDAANCAAHPLVTAVCLTSDVLEDGIGKPEKAELVCGGTVLITSGGNPVAVGRGAAGCYFTWLAWQIFG